LTNYHQMLSKESAASLRVGHSIIGYSAILAVGVFIVYVTSNISSESSQDSSLAAQLYSLDNQTPMAFGACLAVIGVVGLLHAVMRVRATTFSKPTVGQENDDENFDADAALERYLAHKSKGVASTSTPQVTPPASPASLEQQRSAPTGFGRRGI
jgi:hypothetical protein